MKLRIERRHQYGNSNSEFRSKTLGVPPQSKNKFATISALRVAQYTKTPVELPQVDVKDSQNALSIVHNKNQAHLKGIPQITKRIVTGNTFDKSVRPFRLKKLDTDHQMGSNEIETRPVYWNRGDQRTAETEFDLSRIINFKKALFCRYSKRKNHGKTFFVWDKSMKGYIDETDIVGMSEKLGLPINEKEAKLLIACADIDKNGKLNPKEFMNLIFNQKIISSLETEATTAKMNEEKLRGYLTNKLEEINAVETKAKIFNKIQKHKTYLQKVINAEEFNKKDYSIPKERFVSIMSNMSNKDKILNQQEIDFLYNQLKDKTDSVNLYELFYKVKEHENTEYCKLISEADLRGYEHELVL